jgi:hypothetical protein
MEEETYKGIGRTERRRMIRKWKEEGNGLSLRAWAARQHPVGDAAYVWLRAKRKRGKT